MLVNVAIREKHYKVLYGWHLTPVKLHKMIPNVDGSCWCCRAENADHIHIWWDCDNFQGGFLNPVHRIIQEVLKKEVPQQPRIMLVADFR